VTGIDLDPLAIALAQREAAKRGLNIHYAVGDVCAGQDGVDGRYDLIVDSFCLQSIVTDADRAALMHFVKRRLQPNGYYLICTAGFSPVRRYDEAHFDPQSGMVYVRVDDGANVEDVIEIGGTFYIPYRRHLHAEQLTSEVAAFGFIVKWQHVDTHGNIALLCTPIL
jgi:SAM-dependent methyltransferase